MGPGGGGVIIAGADVVIIRVQRRQGVRVLMWNGGQGTGVEGSALKTDKADKCPNSTGALKAAMGVLGFPGISAAISPHPGSLRGSGPAPKSPGRTAPQPGPHRPRLPSPQERSQEAPQPPPAPEARGPLGAVARETPAVYQRDLARATSAAAAAADGAAAR